MAFVERDLQFEDYRVHAWEGGSGFPLLLLHGTGPGTSTIGNYVKIMGPLAARYRVLAADQIGFGRSGRKSAEPYFDFGLWVRQAQFLLDRLEGSAVGIFGHSLSGAIALRLAAANPRVTKVLTTGAIGTRFKVNRDLETTWTFPEGREDLRAAIKTLVYDDSVITDAFLDDRLRILHADGYGSYFRAMFGGDKQRLLDSTVLDERELEGIDSDVIMLHGRDDRPVPAAQTTLMLGRTIRNCDVMLIGKCGHSPSLEHPDKVLAAAYQIFG